MGNIFKTITRWIPEKGKPGVLGHDGAGGRGPELYGYLVDRLVSGQIDDLYSTQRIGITVRFFIDREAGI